MNVRPWRFRSSVRHPRRLAGKGPAGPQWAAVVLLALATVAMAGLEVRSTRATPRAASSRSAGPGTVADYAHVGTWALPQGPSEPLDLALGAGGDLYVADGHQRAVLAYHANGTRWASWPPPVIADVLVPLAVAYDAGRQRVYTLWQRYDTVDGGGEPTPGPLYLDRRGIDGSTDNTVLPLQFVPGASDMAMDPTTGDLLVLSAAAVYRLRMPNATLAGSFPVASQPGLSPSLAVLRDGRVVVAGPNDGELRLYAPDGAPLAAWRLGQGVPVALGADDAGLLYVLLRQPAQGALFPLVVVLNGTGAEVASYTAGALAASPVPPGAWPWSLAVSAAGAALTTGASRFELHRFEPGWVPAWALSGRWRRERYVPVGHPTYGEAPMALAANDSGGVDVLDAAEGRVVAFDANGRATVVAAAPYAALDLALDDSGRRFVTTSDGWLDRLAPGDQITPTWRTACGCDLGGRLAAIAGSVFVTRPRGLAIGAIDGALGTNDRGYQLPEAVGLWPSDVAIGPDGQLYSADLVSAQVHRWRAGQPEAWPAGLLAGPRRLAGGHLADGTPVMAGLMADGLVEMHTLDGNLVSRWLPVLAGGNSFSPLDVAMDTEGLIWLADARTRAVHLFAPGASIPPTPPVPPTPAPTTDLTCLVQGDKVAAPARLVLGNTVGVTLTLAASCPARARLLGADVVLVIDRSLSMATGGLVAAQDAARAFVELLDVRYHRVALVSFSDEATVNVPLTTNVPVVLDGLRALDADGGTNIAAAIERAAANLRDFGRPEALPVIVLLTDGRLDPTAQDPRPLAEQARNGGVQLYAIGLGRNVDEGLLRQLAGGADRYFFAPTPGDLFPIYGQILRLVLSSLAGNLVIEDVLADGMGYVDQSARPPSLVSFDRLSWGRSLLPATGITLTYQLRPSRPGCQPTSRQAVASYTDADGASREHVFPLPTVCVDAPTPTPTRPPTATPTTTPTPAVIHLPIVYRDACVPGYRHADVVLLIDTSDSMAGEKLAKAKLAAVDFVGLLQLPEDQAAVIGFDSGYHIAAPLTGSRGQLETAIARLSSGSGTQIDRALRAAVGELRSSRHLPASRPVIVLLSDGRHNGDPRDVLAAAEEARGARMVVYAIGLGADADANLLRQAAGPERYYAAPDADALAEIYRAIAGIIPCR